MNTQNISVDLQLFLNFLTSVFKFVSFLIKLIKTFLIKLYDKFR